MLVFEKLENTEKNWLEPKVTMFKSCSEWLLRITQNMEKKAKNAITPELLNKITNFSSLCILFSYLVDSRSGEGSTM